MCKIHIWIHCALPLFSKRFDETLRYKQHANVHVEYDVIAYFVNDIYASIGRFDRGFLFLFWDYCLMKRHTSVTTRCLTCSYVISYPMQLILTDFLTLYFLSNYMYVSRGDPIWNLIDLIFFLDPSWRQLTNQMTRNLQEARFNTISHVL